jgi:hypothetical protein
MSDTPVTEESVTTDQFRRNLDQIRIDPVAKGPELTIGDITLDFRKKAPVKALAALVSSTDQVQGMLTYIKLCLKPGQEAALEALLEEIDIEGLGEILNALGEAYTSFPEKS